MGIVHPMCDEHLKLRGVVQKSLKYLDISHETICTVTSKFVLQNNFRS